MQLPVDLTGSKNAVQAAGSSVSYGKRYTVSALLNLTSRGEDDDARSTNNLVKQTIGQKEIDELQAAHHGCRHRHPDFLHDRARINQLEQLPAAHFNDAMIAIKERRPEMNEIVQRSPEWFAARLGSLGASEVYEAIARTKTGWGASRANVMARKIVERLTGMPQDTYVNAAMQDGIDTEPEARVAYEFLRNVEVVEIGLIRHPSIRDTHASPDGLIGEDGLLEIKCPQSAKHIETLLGQAIDGRYVTQMQWQMACSGRQWCDFVSYDPRHPGLDAAVRAARRARRRT